MEDAAYDPASDMARKLASMDFLTLDRTMQMFQDMKGRNEGLKVPVGTAANYASQDKTATPGRPVSPMSRELRARRQQIEIQLRQAQHDMLRLNDLIRLLDGE